MTDARRIDRAKEQGRKPPVMRRTDYNLWTSPARWADVAIRWPLLDSSPIRDRAVRRERGKAALDERSDVRWIDQ